MTTVDLGCGWSKRGDIGSDVFPHPGVDVVCHLGFEPIPLPDGCADRVLAYDFLEHLPVSVHYREEGCWKVYRPRIFLLREVHRILKPSGEFESLTPNYPTSPGCRTRPTRPRPGAGRRGPTSAAPIPT